MADDTSERMQQQVTAGNVLFASLGGMIQIQVDVDGLKVRGDGFRFVQRESKSRHTAVGNDLLRIDRR